MARQNAQILSYNRGIVSPYALGRVDIARMRYSAETMTNWMPRVFGPMMLRPGLGYVGTHTYQQAKAMPIPFVRATNDAQILEMTDSFMRPIVNESPVARNAVSTTVTNGTFSGSITGWTTADEAGAVSGYDASNGLFLNGSGFNAAITYQVLTVAPADQGVEHGIHIVVNKGPVKLRIGNGTVPGLDDLQKETTLGTGVHSLAVTPTSSHFVIYFFNRLARRLYVGSVAVEAAGNLILSTPWISTDLPLLRYDQSADVMYICDGRQQQRKIERRSDHSWSIVLYEPEDGPFMPINTANITLSSSAVNGEVTLTASQPIFKDTHVGALFRASSQSQDIEVNLAGDGQWSDPVRVTGVGADRLHTYTISGTWSGTLTEQRSIGILDEWLDFNTRSGNGTFSHNDTLDNQIVYYRVGFKNTGDYTSGVAHISDKFGGGSITGVARINTVTGLKQATATVLKPFGDTLATTLWYEGAWSNFRGWPTCPALHEGRLWWMGQGYYWGSVSDGYESFDDFTVGDSGPITRTIGQGPVDSINWGMGLQRLVAGTDGTIISARSDSIDSPLTPTNFNLKFPISQGTARIAPVKADSFGYFIHRNTLRVYEMSLNSTGYASLDYVAREMTSFCPEVCQPGIVQIAVQRQPDTRIHCVLSDGTAAVMIRDPVEEVDAWIKVETPGLQGQIEAVVVLPSSGAEDAVYYIVKRTADDDTVYRNYERWALESECVGGTLNKQADAFVTFTNSPASATIIGLPNYMEGHNVVVWADGKDFSPGPRDYAGDHINQTKYKVVGGQITLGEAVTTGIVGLPYQGQFKGVKLAYAAQLGSAIAQTQTVPQLGLMLADTHRFGIQYGPDFNTLADLPGLEEGEPVTDDYVWGPTNGNDIYAKRQFEFAGGFTSDSRLCLSAYAPRPARVLAAIVTVKTNEG